MPYRRAGALSSNMDLSDRYREAYTLAEAWIERQYGLPVVVTDVPAPSTGDLDGASILVDYDLDQWLTDFAACDIAYLMHFYRTDQKRAFRSFWQDATPPLAPLPIPPFQPTKWISRSGTVV